MGRPCFKRFAISPRVFLAGLVITIICIPFALVGIEQYFNPNIEDYVARVGDQEITQNEYQRDFSAYRQNMRRQLGDSLDPAFFDQIVIKRQFLDQMIQRAALMQAMGSSGYAISDSAVRNEISRIEAFQVAGQFNSGQYQLLLSSRGLTPAEFQASVREDLMAAQLPTALGASSVATPAQIDAAIRLEDQKRAATYINVAASEYDELAAVTDEQIEAWFADNSDRYQSEEQVVVEYIDLSASDYAPQIEVDEDLLKQRYELQKARYKSAERRLASHILLTIDDGETQESEVEKARSLAERARAGEDFAALATEYSQDPGSATSGGDLDWVEKGMMVAAFENALFALEVGEVSDPVVSEFGIHVIELRDLEESRGKSFEEVREELADEVRQSEAERLFVAEQDRLLDLTYEDQSSLNLASEEMDVPIQTSEPFSRAQGTGIGAESVVRGAAFATATLEDGVNSDLITIGADRAIVLRVLEHKLPETRPLEEVRDEIAAEVAADQARNKAKDLAEQLLASAQSGESLSDVADQFEREFADSGLVGRRDFQSVTPTLLTELFKLPHPDAETGDSILRLVEHGTDNFAVVSLNQVQPGRPSEADSARRKALAQRL